MPLTICSFLESGQSATSRVKGRFVSAVTLEKVLWSGYPLRRALVMAHPVIPLAPEGLSIKDIL
jgi:hypothetical protein